MACASTTGRPLTPTARGVYVGSARVPSAAIEICASTNQDTALATPTVEFAGRQLVDIGTNDVRWRGNSYSTVRMMLNRPRLNVYGTITLGINIILPF